VARIYPLTEERIAEWQREGRGTGANETWNPWLHIRDFNSRGTVSRDPVEGPGGRVVHVLSDIERWTYLTYFFRSGVLDAQEQFPLEREETRRIASTLNIIHPRDPNSLVDIVMTTDLLVTFQSAKATHRLALSVKPCRELPSHNVAEHSEIERRYWSTRGVAWRYVTDSEECIPSALKSNLQLLHSNRALDQHAEPLGYDGSFIYVRSVVQHELVTAKTDHGLEEFCVRLNRKHSWPPGLATRVALHLLATKQFTCDLAKESLLRLPAKAVGASPTPGVKGPGWKAA